MVVTTERGMIPLSGGSPSRLCRPLPDHFATEMCAHQSLATIVCSAGMPSPP